MIIPGHGLWMKIFFANGSPCEYARPFLVIENKGSFVNALNISSLKGKFHKLGYDSNTKLPSYNPPFRVPSMVKMDELYQIEVCSELTNAIMDNGRTLDGRALTIIQGWHAYYAAENDVTTVAIQQSDFLVHNPQYVQVNT